MMRSLFAGVSGLQNHQVRMDVIGNNIANVNTVGFKASRTTFTEVLNQTISSASAPQGDRGGRNAKQIGLGSAVGSIDVIHSPGGTQSTTSATDLSIAGTGFFIVANGPQQFYTRAGMMDFDGEGSLYSKANGLKVLGYKADSNGNIIESGGRIEPLKITSEMRSMSPVATTEVVLSGNISAFVEPTDEPITRVATVYDSLGATQRVVVSYTKIEDNKWQWSATLENDTSDPKLELGPNDPTQRVIEFNDDGTVLSGGSGNLTIPSAILQPGQAANLEFTLNMGGIKQYAEPTSLVVSGQNGFPSGDLDEVSIDQSGLIIGSYTNGLIRTLGQVALARFENPPGLIKAGDSMFAESVNSGSPVIGRANSAGFGVISSNSLEMSNVDLSQEFTDMIITQRGFQANSRIISAADEMLQELVNLKR